MTILINLLLGIWMLDALLMILVILMQRPKSEGLGAAFGGGMTENIFGAQTTTVLTKITGWLAGIFFVLTFVLSILYAHKSTRESAISREIRKTSAVPAASAAPAAPVAGSPAPNAPPPGASPAGSMKPSDQAVGVVPPASAPVAPSAPPAGSPPPKPKR
jgi:preprotein translocase subunit SecG